MAINFPTSLDVFTDPTASDQLNLPSHSGQHTDLNNAVEALEAKVGIDGSAVTSSIDYRLNTLSYQYVQTVYFTSSGTFTKATYPWLRAVRVKVQGGGGGSGGCASAAASQVSVGAGGGGGGYAEAFVLEASLSSSETVTVGAGGTGGGTPGAGGNGGNSSFGSHAVGNGGAGGGTSGASAAPVKIAIGGAGGSGTGDIVIDGGHGINASGFETNRVLSGVGGVAHLGKPPQSGSINATGDISYAGQAYGGGATGSTRANGAGGALAGAAGGAGIVIVELYA